MSRSDSGGSDHPGGLAEASAFPMIQPIPKADSRCGHPEARPGWDSLGDGDAADGDPSAHRIRLSPYLIGAEAV